MLEGDCIACCVGWWRDVALAAWAWLELGTRRWRELGEEEPKKGSKHSYDLCRAIKRMEPSPCQWCQII